MSQTYYTIKQGETPTLEIQVLDLNNQPVSTSGASQIIVTLFIKELSVADYMTGITNCTVDNYDGVVISSGDTVSISIDRSVSYDFPIGEITAIVLLNKDGVINEYKMIIGEVVKGFDKNKKIN